jgi:hypothetical protein
MPGRRRCFGSGYCLWASKAEENAKFERLPKLHLTIVHRVNENFETVDSPQDAAAVGPI